MHLSIIVPTYNEAENLPIISWLIHKHLDGLGLEWEVIIVDDSSPDGTAEVARELAKTMPQLRLVVVSRPCKLGLGTAYAKGLEHAKGRFVLLLDADLSHHPK
jgi:dolichol-phosphate mannosyltransferase